MSAHLKRAENCIKDETEAAKALAAELKLTSMAGVIFFCSAEYNRDRLAAALQTYFQCPIIGCTTAGEIASTYQNGGIVAVSFSSSVFALHQLPIRSLDHFDLLDIRKNVADIGRKLKIADRFDPTKMLAFLLIDGLSMKEEYITASLHNVLGGIQLIGGSAGDNLTFTSTEVYFNGSFHRNAAILLLIETSLPFQVFKLQHITPTDTDLIITEADPERRIVQEINGNPAALEYANLIGVPPGQLNATDYSRNPVMLQIGGEWYIRSIQRYNDDNSLTFYCAIDTGLHLTIGRISDFRENLRSEVDKLICKMPNILLTLGCDCILRRLQILETDIKSDVESILKPLNFIGFSTYGEQFNSIHVNQTLTGIAFGDR